MSSQTIALFQRVNKALANINGIKVIKWGSSWMQILFMNKKFYLVMCGGYEGLLTTVRKIRRDERIKKAKIPQG